MSEFHSDRLTTFTNKNVANDTPLMQQLLSVALNKPIASSSLQSEYSALSQEQQSKLYELAKAISAQLPSSVKLAPLGTYTTPFDPMTGNMYVIDGGMSATSPSIQIKHVTSQGTKISYSSRDQPLPGLASTPLPEAVDQRISPERIPDLGANTTIKRANVDQIITPSDKGADDLNWLGAIPVEGATISPPAVPDPSIGTPTATTTPERTSQASVPSTLLDLGASVPATRIAATTENIRSNERLNSREIEKSRSLIGDNEFDIYLELSKPILGSTPTATLIAEDIREFQKSNSLKVDGIIGPKTLEKLYITRYSQHPSLQKIRDAKMDKVQDGLSPISKETASAYLRDPLSAPSAAAMRYLSYQESTLAYSANRTDGLNGNKKFPSSNEYFSPDKVFSNYYYGLVDRSGESPVIKRNDGIQESTIQGKIPESLAELYTQLPKFSRKDNNGDGIFILKDRSGKNIFLSYQDSRLQFASLTSPGANESASPHSANITSYRDLNHYYVDDATKGLPFGEQTGGPMPYAVGIGRRGYYIHTGPTTGETLSHGCFRLPTLYATILYHTARANTPLTYSPELRLMNE